jgi:hypothetical protein
LCYMKWHFYCEVHNIAVAFMGYFTPQTSHRKIPKSIYCRRNNS